MISSLNALEKRIIECTTRKTVKFFHANPNVKIDEFVKSNERLVEAYNSIKKLNLRETLDIVTPFLENFSSKAIVAKNELAKQKEFALNKKIARFLLVP